MNLQAEVKTSAAQLQRIIQETIFESVEAIFNKRLEDIIPELIDSIKTKSVKQYFSYEELAYYTGLSKCKIAELKKNNQIPYQTIQGSVRFNKTLIDLWMLSNEKNVNYNNSQIIALMNSIKDQS